jgi:hypothetical protein
MVLQNARRCPGGRQGYMLPAGLSRESSAQVGGLAIDEFLPVRDFLPSAFLLNDSDPRRGIGDLHANLPLARGHAGAHGRFAGSAWLEG